MKILVVEDDQTKLRNIVSALLEIDGVNLGDIEQVSDAVRAKRHLQESRVDVIVLDLHLPDRIDLAPRPDGGLELIRSIATRPNFFVPSHVVAISGNAESLDSIKDSGSIWGVIAYDATSNNWRDQLKTRIRYAQSAIRSMDERPRVSRDCKLGIITALEEELAAVLRLPLGWTPHQFDGDGTIYQEGTIPVDGAVIKVTAASAGRMGMAAAAVLTTKFIEAYRPEYICMAGIAGGVRGRVQLGDVLVADPSWDWGLGKYEVRKGKPRFAANPEQLRISDDIRPKLVQLANDETFLAGIKSSFAGSKPNQSLKCHVEAVASGASVLGDAAVVEEIKLQHRKLYGVEMEIYGMMMAVETCSKPRPIAFSAKAVSDFADNKKNDRIRDYATHVSANFIVEFAKKYIR